MVVMNYVSGDDAPILTVITTIKEKKMAVQNLRRNVSYALSDPLLNVFPAPIVSNRAPTANDKSQIGQTWVDSSTDAAYTLTSIVGNVANWAVSSSGGGGVNQVNADVGFAVPAANQMTMAGSTNIATSGSGDTITFDLANTLSVSGSITAGTGLFATTGGVTAAAGNISATTGAVSAGTIITAGTGISSTAGNISALGGNLTAPAGGLVVNTGITVSTFNEGVVVSDSSGVFSSINGTDGQVLIGDTGANPVWANLTAGTNISIVNGANSITINSAGASTVQYTPVASGPYVVLANDYFIGVDTTLGPITIQLPNTTTTGRVIVIKDSQGTSSSNAITVTTVGGVVLIDGSTSQSIISDYESLQLIFNSAFYEIF